MRTGQRQRTLAVRSTLVRQWEVLVHTDTSARGKKGPSTYCEKVAESMPFEPRDRRWYVFLRVASSSSVTEPIVSVDDISGLTKLHSLIEGQSA